MMTLMIQLRNLKRLTLGMAIATALATTAVQAKPIFKPGKLQQLQPARRTIQTTPFQPGSTGPGGLSGFPSGKFGVTPTKPKPGMFGSGSGVGGTGIGIGSGGINKKNGSVGIGIGTSGGTGVGIGSGGGTGIGIGTGGGTGVGVGTGGGTGVGIGTGGGTGVGVGSGGGVGIGIGIGGGSGTGVGVGSGGGVGIGIGIGVGGGHCHQHWPVCTQPVYVPVSTIVVSDAPTAMEAARQHVLAARQDFAKRNYGSALERIDRVIALMPDNPDLLQFRSLVLFALGEYKDSAYAAHEALARGPGWTWDAIRDLYAKADHYTIQYHALTNAAKSDPESPDAHFLLAYHHLMLGHVEHGRQELETVQKLLPGDPLIGKMLAALPAGATTASNP